MQLAEAVRFCKNYFFNICQSSLEVNGMIYIYFFGVHKSHNNISWWTSDRNDNLKAPADQCNTLITTSCIRTLLEPLQQYSVVSLSARTHIICYTYFSPFLHFWTSHNFVVVEGNKIVYASKQTKSSVELPSFGGFRMQVLQYAHCSLGMSVLH